MAMVSLVERLSHQPVFQFGTLLLSQRQVTIRPRTKLQNAGCSVIRRDLLGWEFTAECLLRWNTAKVVGMVEMD
jgi:hypothetical protein